MSGPSFATKCNPRLFERQWDHEQYLQVDPWPQYLCNDMQSETSRNSRRATAVTKENVARDLKSAEHCVIWKEKLDTWCLSCIGETPDFEDAVDLFVNVMWSRHVFAPSRENTKDHDLEAMGHLKQYVNDSWSKANRRPSAKLGLFRNDHAADYNAWATEDEADENATTGSDEAVDADYRPVPEPHDSRVPRTKKSGPSDSDYTPSTTPRAATPRAATSHAPRTSKWKTVRTQTPDYTKLCQRWHDVLVGFFMSTKTTVGVVDPLLPQRKDVADAVCEMRSVPVSVSKTLQWRQALVQSRLILMLCTLATPGQIFRLSQHVIDSRNSGVWADIFGALVIRWTDKDALEQFKPQVQTPIRVRKVLTRGAAKKLVKIFKAHPDLVPNQGNCFAVFFLFNESNFVACWNDWLLPGLSRHGYQHELLWDEAKLYGALMHFLTNHPTEIDNLPDELQHIVQNTLKHRRMLRDFRRAVFHQHQRYHDGETEEGEIKEAKRNDNAIHEQQALETAEEPQATSVPKQRRCPECVSLGEEEQCIRVVEVHEHAVGKTLHGCVMTLAEESDRLPPRHISGANKSIETPTYMSPRELNFTRFTYREAVWKRCGRDVTILKDSITKKIVGCFCYNAFTKDVLAAMIESHALVTKNKGVRRGGTFQQFAYGKMVPVGARVPQGGAPGDGYAPYAHMTSDTVEAIDALMAHGRDADLLLTALQPYIPDIVRDYRETNTSSSLGRLGTNCVNMYYCSDYMAPIHPDEDIGVSLCSQLEKSGCPDEVLDFIYAHYGLYFETRSNMAWLFMSELAHGSLMPSLSQMLGNIIDLIKTHGRKRAGSAKESQAKRTRHGQNTAEYPPLPLPHQLQRAQPAHPFQHQEEEAEGQQGHDEGEEVPLAQLNLAQHPEPPRIVSNGGHATRRTIDHDARQQNERVRQAMPAAQAYWERHDHAREVV